MKELESQKGDHFSPQSREEHELGNQGFAVPDNCRNCGTPFMEHNNGKCPKLGRLR